MPFMFNQCYEVTAYTAIRVTGPGTSIEGVVSKGLFYRKSGSSCHGAVIGSSVALIIAFHESRVGSSIFVPGLTRCVLTVLTCSIFQLQHSNIPCLKDHVKTETFLAGAHSTKDLSSEATAGLFRVARLALSRTDETIFAGFLDSLNSNPQPTAYCKCIHTAVFIQLYSLFL